LNLPAGTVRRQSNLSVSGRGLTMPADGLQQQNLFAGIFGESVGEHAAGGAGTDDDVVVVGRKAAMRIGLITVCYAAFRAARSRRLVLAQFLIHELA
jgi:hypothetical protein